MTTPERVTVIPKRGLRPECRRCAKLGYVCMGERIEDDPMYYGEILGPDVMDCYEHDRED